MAPVPKFPYTVVLDNLEAILANRFPQMRVIREAGWFLRTGDAESVPGPDLMVVNSQDYDKAAQSGGYFDAQPLLVVEVISPSERKARRWQKVGLYLEAGAGGVLEVDTVKRLVIIYRPDEEGSEAVRDRVQWPF